MRGETGGIDQRKINAHFAERLNHVCVQQDAAFAADLGDFTHRLEHARLVVRGHDRNKPCLGADRARELIRIDYSIARNIQPRYLEIFVLFQMLDGVEYRVMFGFR